MSSVREALAYAAGFLDGKGIDTPEVDAAWLLSHVLGVSRSELDASGSRMLSPGEDALFEELVERRGAREPLAYVLGEWGFRRLTLAVGPQVLVPRPETEVVVERCLERIRDLAEPDVIDIGTGSGAIALAIADEHPGARVVATDISEAALELAAENRARCGLTDRVELVLGHLSAHLPGQFDLVVSNPPYVLPEEWESLQPEIKLYEPYEAVVGVHATQAVARRATAILRQGGWLVLEVGERQAAEVASLLERLGFREVTVTRDLTGRDRVVEGRWAS